MPFQMGENSPVRSPREVAGEGGQRDPLVDEKWNGFRSMNEMSFGSTADIRNIESCRKD